MRAVLLFARSPEAETRAKGLRPQAASIFRGIMDSWRRAALAANASLILPNRQSGDTFGERLAHCAQAAFASGAKTLLIGGIDSPAPDAETMERSFEDLETGRVRAVLGPASDGGLYLIGLASFERALLASMRPRQRDLLAVCSSYFDQNVTILPVASDLDSASDLHRLEQESLWSDYGSLLKLCRLPRIAFSELPTLIGIRGDQPRSSRAPPA